jgi:hypothetical protein
MAAPSIVICTFEIFADDGVVGRFHNGRQETAGFLLKSEVCHEAGRS